MTSCSILQNVPLGLLPLHMLKQVVELERYAGQTNVLRPRNRGLGLFGLWCFSFIVLACGNVPNTKTKGINKNWCCILQLFCLGWLGSQEQAQPGMGTPESLSPLQVKLCASGEVGKPARVKERAFGQGWAEKDVVSCLIFCLLNKGFRMIGRSLPAGPQVAMSLEAPCPWHVVKKCSQVPFGQWSWWTAGCALWRWEISVISAKCMWSVHLPTRNKENYSPIIIWTRLNLSIHLNSRESCINRQKHQSWDAFAACGHPALQLFCRQARLLSTRLQRELEAGRDRAIEKRSRFAKRLGLKYFFSAQSSTQSLMSNDVKWVFSMSFLCSRAGRHVGACKVSCTSTFFFASFPGVKTQKKHIFVCTYPRPKARARQMPCLQKRWCLNAGVARDRLGEGLFTFWTFSFHYEYLYWFQCPDFSVGGSNL